MTFKHEKFALKNLTTTNEETICRLNPQEMKRFEDIFNAISAMGSESEGNDENYNSFLNA